MDYNELSYEELKEAKAEIAELLKDKREEAKAEAKAQKEADREVLSEAGKELAKIGNVINCVYKGEDVQGTITKINENTISIKLSDTDGNPIMKDGKQISTWKYYWQIS